MARLQERPAGRGAPIVLLHGWMGKASSWRKVAPLLAEHVKAAGRISSSVSVLAIGGEYGIPGTFEQMKLVHDAPQGGVIAGCGHFLAEEKPEELAAWLVRFIREAPPRKALGA